MQAIALQDMVRMHRELAFAFHHIKGVAEVFHSSHIRHYGLLLVDFEI